MKSKSNPEPDITRVLEIDQSSSRRKGLKRWLIWVLLLSAVITTVVIWKRMENSNSVQYKTHEVVRGDLTVTVTATGTLKPTNSVDVGSELSGTVKSVEADYNSKVKVGQVLAKLDTTKLEATLTQSGAALESAKAKVLQAQATVTETRAKFTQLQRVRELSSGKVPSQLDIDAAEAAFCQNRLSDLPLTASFSHGA
jgi:HlyD family secretion protein